MTTAGGGGVSDGSDYVSMRMAIDIPDNSVEGLKGIKEAVDGLRTSLEAVSHIEADQTRYLDQMSEAATRAAEAHAHLTQQLQTMMSISARFGMGSGTTGTGVPSGAQGQEFSGMNLGMGIPQLPNASASRPPQAADVASQLAVRPAEYLNATQAAGGAEATVGLSHKTVKDVAQTIADRERTNSARQSHNTRAEPHGARPSLHDDWGDFQAKIHSGEQVASRAMEAVGPGATFQGSANMALQGINALRRRFAGATPARGAGPTPAAESGAPAGDPPGAAGTGSPASPAGAEAGEELAKGGGLMGLTKFLGPIAGVATAALSAFGLIQKGGAMIQGFRNEASVRGGAAGEGAQVAMKAQMLAMNPFISQDQARQIYQSVMSEGYADASGSGADNVIDFMKDNLTKMNISVADSAKMLNSTISGNVSGDKNSVNGAVEMLRKELDSIRDVSSKGVISTPKFTAAVSGLQDQLIAAGVDPEQAASQAMTAETVGSGDRNTAGDFARGVSGLASSGQGSALLRRFGGTAVPAGLLPQATADYLGQTGKLNEASENVMKHFAQMASRYDNGTYVGRTNAVYMFRNLLQSSGLGSMEAAQSIASAKTWYAKLLGKDDMVDDAEKEDGGADFGSSGSSDSTPAPPSPGGGTSFTRPEPPAFAGPSSGAGTVATQTHSVTIDLTPAAAQLLKVQGPPTVRLTPTQVAANRGQANAQVNSDPGS
jgi:hypothetical protein